MGTKMKRKLIATAVAVLTVLNYMIIPVSAAGTQVNAANWNAIRTAVNNNSACEITLTADITLSANNDTAITIDEGKDVTLNLNNHTIRRNCTNNTRTNYCFFDVYGSFTLVDNSEEGKGTITGANSSQNNYPGIRVRSTGEFTMKSGTISGNTAYRGRGGAVYIDGGKFIMEGGTLDHNNAARGGNGGRGGAVYINSAMTGMYPNFSYIYGSFEMKGGTIKNCGTRVYNEEYASQGGAVYVVSGCTFTMSGGSIGTSEEGNSVTYNNNTARGGAVYVAGTFTMTGGSLCNNKATGSTMTGQQVYVAENGVFNLNGGVIEKTASGDAVYVDNNATFNMDSGSITGCASGSAVYLYANNSAFTMNGGTISDCKTAANGNGGAVNLNRGTFTMNGGTITNNSAAKGGGVYVADSSNAKFNLYGGTITGNTGSGVYVDRNGVISVGKEDATNAINVTENTDSDVASNIYLSNVSKTIAITGPIKDGSQIAVRFNNNATDITATSGYSTANADVDPATIFLADQEGYEVELYNDEVHYMIHDWQYDGFDWTGNDTDGYTAAAVKYVDGNNAAFTRSVDAELAVDTESNPATCTEGGKITYTASIAADKALDGTARSDVKEVNTDAIAHKNAEAHPAVDATCLAAGNSAYWYCPDCEKYYSDAACTTEIAENSWVIEPLGHDLEKVEAVAATCTTAGNTEYYKCTRCGKFFSDAAGENEIAENSWVIEPLGHDLEKVEAVPATCTTAGNSEYYKCKTCNKFFSDATGENEIAENSWVIEALGHDLEKVEAVAATCTTAGNSEYYKCKTCGKFFSDAAGENEIAENSWVIDPLGHDLEKVEAVAATCTTAGNTEYYKCTRCGKFYSDAAGENEIAENSWVIEPLGHDLEKVEAVAATCTTAGNSEYYKCKTCNKFFSDAAGENEIAENSWVIEPLGHDLEKVEAVAATCTTAGNTEYYKCTRCGKFYSDAAGENEIAENSWVIEPLGHDLEKVEAVPATCTTAGNSEYYKCKTCGKFFSDAAGENEIAENSWVIEALGHDLEKVDAVAATCTTAGNSEYYKCTRCGKFYSDAAGENEIAENSWVIEPLGHTLTKTAAVPATCETAGNGEYWTCSVCGKHFGDAEGKTELKDDAWIIPASHTLTKVEAVEPTCEENGNIEYWECTACGKYFSDENCTTEYTADQLVLDAAHKYADVKEIPATCTSVGCTAGRKCSVCGHIDYGCEEIPMLDHTSVEVKEVPATCTKAGTTAGTKCSVCGTVLSGCKPIKALGHDWSDWKVTKPATVDAKGEETRTCSRCDASETRDIAKLTPAPGSDVTLKLDKSSMNVICGQTGTIKATVKGTTDKVTWKSSNTKIATVDANGKVTAKQAGSVTITATVAGKKATCKVQILYKDVTNTSEFWYAPTYYLTDKNVVKGYANQTEFRPANVCTRAQMVTFIWRLMGEPAPKAKTCKFNDVKETDYFYKACIWGNENHIVEGYKDGSFGPQITCARKHAVTFLWRLAGKPEPTTKENKFSDVKEKDYYYKATLWASETKILAGYDDGTFRPEGDCLRRQMVTFLYKYDKFVNAKKG